MFIRMIRIVVVFLLTLAGCQVPTRVSMEGDGGRTAYNIAIQMTNSQQMLLNLVRLRYADSPLFLDVSSITTQNTFRSAVSPVFPIPGFNEQNPFHLGTDFSWEAQPTITYAPLEGPSFAGRLLRPIDLRTIQLLCYSGWDVDRIFRMMVQNVHRLSNAPEATAPVMDQMPNCRHFFEAGKLMRHFQKRGDLRLGVTCKECKEEEPDEVSMQIAFPDDCDEARRLAELIDADRQGSGYVKDLQLGFSDKGELGVMPRSILSCMYYLSHGVQPPEEHIANRMVIDPVCSDENKQEWRSIFSDLIVIRSCHFCPKDAYIAVKYRNYWFYIADCDLVSKKTFALLLQLYNLNAIVPKNRGPILSLPLH
jgi:hypothetical protein